ncbi:MAG: hypothetical protein RIK87_21725 [Fuerstiella sp.]
MLNRLLNSSLGTGLLAGVLVCAAGLPSATAQETVPAPSDLNQAGLLQNLKPGASVVYKDPETGEVTILPPPAQEILRQVEERTLLQQSTRLFDIQELNVEGSVAEDFVDLQVRLRIDIHPEREWVRVPIGFNDFQLTDLTHSTDVTDGQATLEKSRLPEKTWLLYGRGTHLLNLKLIGAARISQNSRRRLKLDAPAATISRLLLKLSDKVESAELSSEQPFQFRKDELAGSAVLETWGLSEATEVSWVPELSMPGQAVTVQAASAARMELDLSTASLVVRQPLSISGGSVEQLRVQLPEGFGTVAITGRNADGDEIVKPGTSPTSRATVIEFTAPVTGTVTLQYDIGLNNTPYPQELSIRLPDIENVINESGDLEVIVPVGLDVEIDRFDIRHVRRKRVENARNSRAPVFAYRLLSSESVLRMKVSEPEAFYSVVPQITFETERNNVLMTARFAINMLAGSLKEMDIVWPEYAQDRWKILPAHTRMIGDTSPPTGFPSTDDPNIYTILFPDRMSGQFEFELQAFRPRSTVADGDGFRVFLPDIVSPTPHTTIVSLVESDELSMQLFSLNEQTTFPLLPSSRWPDHLKERNAPLSVRLVDSPDQAVEIRITPQKSEVRVGVEAALSVVQESLHVRQTMSYDVRHLDLLKVTLSVPNVNPSVRLKDAAEPLERLSVQGADVSYALPTRLRGEFTLQIDYYWSPDESGNLKTALPLVLPAAGEAELTEIVVGTNAPETLVIDRSADWGRVHSDTFSAAWQTSGRHDRVPIALKHSLGRAAVKKPEFVVLKSVVRGSNLVTSITGVYSQPVDLALFSLSTEVDGMQAFVGRRPATMDFVSADGDAAEVVQVRTQEATEEARTVTLIAQQPVPRYDPLFRAWRPDLPRIAGTDADCNTLWIVAQNPDDSVMYWGNRMTEIGNAAASQLAVRDDESIRAAVTALLSPSHPEVHDTVMELIESSVTPSGRFQILTGTPFPEQPLMVSVSRRVSLLIAAVAGLLVYFAFLKLQPLSLTTAVAIVAAAATAVVAVVPGPGQLILLRLIPGCVIALVAAVLQRMFGRREAPPAVTLKDYDQSTIFTVERPALSHDSQSSGSTQTQKTVLSVSSEASIP